MKAAVKAIVVCLTALVLNCQSAGAQARIAKPRAQSQARQACLPTGACIDAAGRTSDVGNMPLALVLSPEGDRVVLSLNGWRQQGLQVVERETGRVVQTVAQAAAFYGLAFSPDGRTLYASGGNEDVVYVYSWRERQATLTGSIELAKKEAEKPGTRYPAGLALSRDGRKLYVAENLADTLAVVDVESKRVEQRLRTENYPYGVVVAPDGRVYVSAWGGTTVSVFVAERDGALKEGRRITVGRHPSALVLNETGTRLFVASASTNRIAVVDARDGRTLATLDDAPPSGKEGSTPNALALSPDGKNLFVAEADNNAVAVFSLSRRLSDVKSASGDERLAGRIPVGWYPSALLSTRDSLVVLNGKGRGTKPNPQFRQSGGKTEADDPDYVLGQLDGTLTTLPAGMTDDELRRLTRRVARANNWNRTARRASKYPPFKHVIYVIKENRTYDQVFGDMHAGDGDASLLFFPRDVSPNHHALAERFGLFDRFFVNAEVSSQGHVWSTAAYVTDYTEKTVASLYSDRRDANDRDDVDEPAAGYLWNNAIRKGLTLRNYGEYAEPVPDKNKSAPARYRATKAALRPYTSAEYPAFDMRIPDQTRAGVWLKEFRQYVKRGNLPALEILHLPSDHTSGARAGRPTPRAHMADNDLALGRIVEAVSNSPYWKDTILFVLEDDSQDGPDHVDSHRSVLLVVSAYNRAGLVHRFVNTTDVFATVEEILGLPPLSQFDSYGRPLREIFNASPDLRPYSPLTPQQSLDEKNPSTGANAQASARLDLDEVDRAGMALFNQILWRAIKGDDCPYPATRRMPTLEITRTR